jgi:hypothetical protein
MTLREEEELCELQSDFTLKMRFANKKRQRALKSIDYMDGVAQRW